MIPPNPNRKLPLLNLQPFFSAINEKVTAIFALTLGEMTVTLIESGDVYGSRHIGTESLSPNGSFVTPFSS